LVALIYFVYITSNREIANGLRIKIAIYRGNDWCRA